MKFDKLESNVVNDQYGKELVEVLQSIEQESDPNLDANSAYQIAVKQAAKELGIT